MSMLPVCPQVTSRVTSCPHRGPGPSSNEGCTAGPSERGDACAQPGSPQPGPLFQLSMGPLLCHLATAQTLMIPGSTCSRAGIEKVLPLVTVCPSDLCGECASPPSLSLPLHQASPCIRHGGMLGSLAQQYHWELHRASQV